MTNVHKSTDAIYVMGHPTGEEQRLHRLGQLLYPSTKRLFEQAGITSGMKVLDVGSGAGDVALLLAELVGPTGSVVGVELHPPLLEVAQARVRTAGLTNIAFLAGDIREVALERDFDSVVGRNVLMYVADPSAVLRVGVEHLRPGGIVAFQEVEWSISEQIAKLEAIPALVRQAAAWVYGAFRKAGTEMQMSFKFPGAFLEADLPFPTLSLDGILGTDPAWVGYDFLADALRDILPKLREYGILKEPLDAEDYVAQLQAEIIEQRAFLPLFFAVGAWARKEARPKSMPIEPTFIERTERNISHVYRAE